MTRRVIEHKAVSNDHEDLTIITVFEPGINKVQAKKVIQYTRRHYVLVNYDGDYDWK